MHKHYTTILLDIYFTGKTGKREQILKLWIKDIVNIFGYSSKRTETNEKFTVGLIKSYPNKVFKKILRNDF